MITAVADTHAVIWYIFANDRRCSARAKTFIDGASNRGEQIGVSTISLVEIVYLVEKGSVAADTQKLVAQALADPESVFVELHLVSAIVDSLPKIARAAIPDMPDRIIAATALHLGVPLISRDGKIQVSGIETIW